MKNKLIKIGLILWMIIYITIPNVQALGLLEKDYDIASTLDLRGKSVEEARQALKEELTRLGAPQTEVSKADGLQDGKSLDFRWNVEVKLILKDFKTTGGVNSGGARADFDINVNGEIVGTTFTTYSISGYINLSEDDIGKGARDSINSNMVKKANLPSDFQFGANDYSVKSITQTTAKETLIAQKQLEQTAHIAVILGENGKIDKVDATASGKWVGSKPRSEWFTAKLKKGSGQQLSDPVENPEDYNPGNVTGYSKVFNIAGIIIATVKVIGVSLSVILLVIIGIKYLMGSIEEKAEYKKTMIPYVVGIVLLFAGSFLVQIIYDLVKGI